MARKSCGPPTVNITVGATTVKDHTHQMQYRESEGQNTIKSGAIISLVTVYCYSMYTQYVLQRIITKTES